MRWVEFDKPHEHRTPHSTTLLRPGDRWRISEKAWPAIRDDSIGHEVDGPHPPAPVDGQGQGPDHQD